MGWQPTDVAPFSGTSGRRLRCQSPCCNRDRDEGSDAKPEAGAAIPDRLARGWSDRSKSVVTRTTRLQLQAGCSPMRE